MVGKNYLKSVRNGSFSLQNCYKTAKWQKYYSAFRLNSKLLFKNAFYLWSKFTVNCYLKNAFYIWSIFPANCFFKNAFYLWCKFTVNYYSKMHFTFETNLLIHWKNRHTTLCAKDRVYFVAGVVIENPLYSQMSEFFVSAVQPVWRFSQPLHKQRQEDP